MATKKQKEELMQTLKFTPIQARIQLGGYGGECYIGSVDRQQYEFFKAHRIDIEQWATDWDGDNRWDFVPQTMRPFDPGNPYDCDDLFHQSGATMDDSSYITVEDDKGNTLWESNLDITNLCNRGVTVTQSEELDSNDLEPGRVIFWSGQGEKGCFFDGEITLRAPFDLNKLCISYGNGDGWHLASGVEYDGVDVEGYDGYNTTGKWSEHKFWIAGEAEEVYTGVERDEDGNPVEDEESEDWDPAKELAKIDVPVLEGEEEWAQKAIDRDTWNGIPYSPWFGADQAPVRKGKYEIMEADNSWPFPQFAQWTGRAWQIDGKETKVREWRGLGQPAE